MKLRRHRLDPEAELRRPDPLLRFLDDPVTALVPWFAFNFLLEPMSFLGASLLALGLSAALVLATWMRGEDPRAFEVSDVVLFAGVVVVALFDDPNSQSWLSDHADVVSNVGLTVVAIVSLMIHRPFTAPYTAARFPGVDSHLLARLDRESTYVWSVALFAASAVAIYGEWILGQQTNLWTAWILQTVPLVVALELTVWIDRRTIARAEHDPELEPPRAVLLRDLFAWLAPIGVLSLVFDGGAPILGWVLVVTGAFGAAVASVRLRARSKRPRSTASERAASS